MPLNQDLVKNAYSVGRSRNVSLSIGYFVSPDGQTIFCQNPNSFQGVFVGKDSGFGDCPSKFVRFDMSEALAQCSL